MTTANTTHSCLTKAFVSSCPYRRPEFRIGEYKYFCSWFIYWLIVILVLSQFQQWFSIVLNFVTICVCVLYTSFCAHVWFVSGDQPPYMLTPWSRVLLEKLTGSRVVKKFPAFYAPRRLITSFTTARHLSLFWATSLSHVGQWSGNSLYLQSRLY